MKKIHYQTVVGCTGDNERANRPSMAKKLCILSLLFTVGLALVSLLLFGERHILLAQGSTPTSDDLFVCEVRHPDGSLYCRVGVNQAPNLACCGCVPYDTEKEHCCEGDGTAQDQFLCAKGTECCYNPKGYKMCCSPVRPCCGGVCCYPGLCEEGECIPEPATILLATAGFGAVGFWMRRQRESKNRPDAQS